MSRIDLSNLTDFCARTVLAFEADSENLPLVIETLITFIAEKKPLFLEFCQLTAKQMDSNVGKNHPMKIAMRCLALYLFKDIAAATLQMQTFLRDFQRNENEFMTTFCFTVIDRLSFYKDFKNAAQFSGMLPVGPVGRNKRNDDDDFGDTIVDVEND